MKKPELNITPFVDIMLVLLAILMVSVTVSTYQEKTVNLPEGSKTTPAAKKPTITITIKKDGSVIVNKEQIPMKNFLEEFNLKYGNFNKNSLVYIAADKNIKYQTFMKVYSAVVKLGFTQIGLLTK
ncbi:ExbD\tolR family transport protein [Nautilia profundicola AmH]|uniref:ExbD\tolR family transport protein n=1 Tax=Nautilia profundicola (strain ATCC BAA-1463 / DSM 18972 / AmH) TaxID=598659 RepID=B9L7Z0_NAUPA|nr:biopolymer transporter ExbD [Nautilia profundicola]ACM92645.1 ExbD\tolR family transport protein [Nautilia profundicola AmH]